MNEAAFRLAARSGALYAPAIQPLLLSYSSEPESVNFPYV